MNPLKAMLLILVLIGSGAACGRIGFISGRKSAPKVQVYDLKAKAFVPLVAPDGAKIVVASPEGFQPGILAQKSTDGKFILILPPSLMGDQPEPPQTDPNRTVVN